ncbi:MAG: hypothetical protein DWQ47_08800 [Acidobacteria bacterium]|nr:MAG: hypothetical protein DWQ32_16900 [Acidobacteriota bacterium]REJ98997.1 MAG: hypothetical protein DWQ38_13080 [Acidobacteriota bacterium]REK16283.1 MAG: hypothetical protein DWQ43_04610 [Acidobacteriota bacterium]REK43964.1 MAG: hypothetical protein DWQ47_08800 [Acidobacteriota bacterium]
MAKGKAKTNETIGKAVELTQEGAKATLTGAVKTAELTEDYVQGLYKLGYDTNVEGLKIAKNYWDTASKIRQDWIKLFANTGEQVIDAASDFELPYQDQVMDLGKDVFENVEKTFSNITGKAKAAAK